MFGDSTISPGEWLNVLQWGIAVSLPVFWLWYYRQFVGRFVRFAATYVGVTAILVLLYLMVYGLAGSDLGIPYLFWHDDFWARSFSSAGATMLLALLGMIAYYLDPYPWATSYRVGKFLEADEVLKQRITGGHGDQPPVAVPSAEGAQSNAITLHWWSYLVFWANGLFDPLGVTRFQRWLEPHQENALMMQRFLRAARGPFLVMLVAPAVLPAVFSKVPHAAPTGELGLERLLGVDEPPTYDVSHQADRPVNRDFREVSMSWYLARAEMAATAAAIPRDPPVSNPHGPQWTDPDERHRTIDQLYNKIRESGPGPDRAIRRKRLEQLYNYERLVNLKKWWNQKTR